MPRCLQTDYPSISIFQVLEIQVLEAFHFVLFFVFVFVSVCMSVCVYIYIYIYIYWISLLKDKGNIQKTTIQVLKILKTFYWL
jgi:hypothetical protein